MMAQPPYNNGIAPCRPACATRIRKVRPADLPLCCPLPGECVWNAHPRVYLTLDEKGHAQCPYCGTRYALEAPANTLNQYNDE